ncbi:class I SAM-dependent methyltransferase family protein [Candidatus Woesearchaeota archaeon]|nr:class I SAM-dependent methyltransferase family protein [Candidatus Woesearchaeota archaeon]
MVLCVKVPLKKAQEVKQFILQNSLLDHDFVLSKDKSSIFFPVLKKDGLKKAFDFVVFEEKALRKNTHKKQTFVESVSAKLSAAELDVLRRAFDVTGDIAIMEIPPELLGKEKLLAETLLKTQKNVKTVLKKAGVHETEFRTQSMDWLAGEKRKETVHKELGIRLKLDVEKVYFSPRLSTERKRVADQVKPGEEVLVMFSGCAPYPCIISRHTKAKEIIGVELNPFGHKYGEENVRLNKIRNVTLFNGDVREVVPALKRKFDRIIMPLPKAAGDFLDIALDAAKKGTIINFYAFEEIGNFEAAHKRILNECSKKGLKCRILRTVKCGQHAPRVYRICVDFTLL